MDNVLINYFIFIKMNIEIENYLLNFVIENTKKFDASHNYLHALKVTELSHKIMKSMQNNYNKKMLTTIAMLHDVCDHKYPNSIIKDELLKFININFTEAKMIIKIIDNISFSNERNGLREKLPEYYENYLIAVSDADKLEALGINGIKRCEQFAISHGKKIPEDIINHCNDKLLRLLPEGYIRSKLGKQLAIPLHIEVYHYVHNYKK